MEAQKQYMDVWLKYLEQVGELWTNFCLKYLVFVRIEVECMLHNGISPKSDRI
jgi:hypothetical protein